MDKHFYSTEEMHFSLRIFYSRIRKKCIRNHFQGNYMQSGNEGMSCFVSEYHQFQHLHAALQGRALPGLEMLHQILQFQHGFWGRKTFIHPYSQYSQRCDGIRDDFVEFHPVVAYCSAIRCASSIPLRWRPGSFMNTMSAETWIRETTNWQQLQLQAKQSLMIWENYVDKCQESSTMKVGNNRLN